jgi:pyruvate kinase
VSPARDADAGNPRYNCGVGEGNPHILTKIVATVGPACADVDTLVKLIAEGVRVFRINFSHGTLDQFERTLGLVRAAEAAAGIPVGALGDLSGPKIRVGKVAGDGVMLEVGQRVEFVREALVASPPSPGEAAVFSSTLTSLIDDVDPGQRVLINDGAIRMLALEKDPADAGGRLACTVTHGGLVTSGKGINLPDSEVSAPSLTEWDLACVEWAVAHEIDYLALSFVRHAGDIVKLKAELKQRGRGRSAGRRLPIIAKIEKPQALDHLDAILDASDGLMVARGDLGVEMDLAEVPVIQKRIIQLAHDHGKPVIVATQMLQSMIEEPSPTRAEASDVANAIFDGADAVMLSGETAVGRFPVVAVNTMRRIIAASERHMRSQPGKWFTAPRKLQDTRYRTAALAHGVSVIVRDIDARLVATWSQLGGGARYLSQNRLAVPILAASSDLGALRQMGLLFGVHPIHMSQPKDSDTWLNLLDQFMLDRGWADEGDPIVVAKGEPLGTSGVTNKIRIHYVGDVCRVEWNM